MSVSNYHGQAYRGLVQLSRADPERVISYLRKNPYDELEFHQLADIAKIHPTLALKRLSEMSDRGVTADSANNSKGLFRALAKDSPELLEAALESLSPVLRKEGELALVGQRLAESFQEEVRSLWARPDGWEVFTSLMSGDDSLGAKLAGELKDMPEAWKNSLAFSPQEVVPRASLKWLELDLEAAGFTVSQADRIRDTAIRYLGYANPEETISKIDSLNLGSEERSQVLRSALSKYRNSPKGAERLIDMLPSAEDKSAARKIMESLDFRLEAKAEKAPSEWLESLTTSATPANAMWNFSKNSEYWSQEKISEFEEKFQSLPGGDRGKIAVVLAENAWDSNGNDVLVGNAVKYLVENPQNKTGSGHEHEVATSKASEYALRLSSENLSAASTWIKSLPQGDAKKWAQRNVAMDLRQYDPAAVREWIRTLPQAERDDLNGYLEGGK